MRNKLSRPPRKTKVSRVERVFKLNPILKLAKFNLPKLDLAVKKEDSKGQRRLKFLRHFRDKSVYRFISRMPTALNAIYGIERNVSIDLIRHYILTYESWVLNRGEVNAIKFLKELHGICLRFCSNSKFDKLDYVSNLPNGIPSIMEPFIKLLTGSLDERRCSLCILSLYKMVIVRGDEPTLDSIERPFELPLNYSFSYVGEFYDSVGKQLNPRALTHPESSYFRGVLEEMFPRKYWRRRLSQITRCSSLHVSPRNGPNGPAIATALADLQGLEKSPELLASICELATLTKNNSLLKLLTDNSLRKEGECTRDDHLSNIHSRLSIKIEPGAKTRYFAIVDYFSQSVLKGFHKWIFKWLSKTKEDGTKSQDSVCQIVRQWTVDALSQGVEVFSTDLSKATDRLPAYLQFEIVSRIAGKRFAKLWYNIITQRDFYLPNRAGTVSFNCGQPLGAYSSWAMLAVTHHVICRHALKRIGKQYGKIPQFVIVGDDNALIGRDLEESYHYLMNTLCRVSISPLKGFSPDTVSNLNPLPNTKESSVAEFCKRVFFNGHEISTISPMTIYSSFEYPSDFPMAITDLNKRQVPLTIDGLGSLAWLNYNPDQATILVTFPLTSALPSNILEEAKPLLMELGVEWYQEEFNSLLAPLYYSVALERVGDSVMTFVDRVTKFRKSFNEVKKVRTHSFDNPEFYNFLLHELTSSMAYDVAKLVDSMRTKEFEPGRLKRLSDGLINLDDLSDSFFNRLKPEDKPKRISRRLAQLAAEVHKLFRENNPRRLDIYRYYKREIDIDSIKALSLQQDVAFVEVEDDWELVIPINFEANTHDSEPDDFM